MVVMVVGSVVGVVVAVMLVVADAELLLLQFVSCKFYQ